MPSKTKTALELMAEVWRRADQAREKYRTVQRPANSFTAREYAERYSLNYNTARGQLQTMAIQGKLQPHAVMISDDGGVLRRNVVYTVPNRKENALPINGKA